MDFFDHSVTDYPLEGKHQGIECKKCHKRRFTDPINFTSCSNCHADYHKGEFVKNGQSPDCVECHSLEHGFDYSLFTVEKHQKTDFPLEGAHLATPCFACHVSEQEDRWTFHNKGTACVDCHEDIHEGLISSKYYPKNNCKKCHSNDAWAQVNFDHNQTGWPLDGRHAELSCRDCHFEISTNNELINQQFNTLETTCVSCHENVHGDTFAIDGVTDCTRCHITESWYPQNFDHNTTAFPLEGRHAELACSACHEVLDEHGSIVVVYKLGKTQCIDCHQ